MSESSPHIAILGAGPIGLEAALAAAEGEFSFTLYEASPEGVGGNVRDWGHVRLFTPWDLNVSPRARRMLSAARVGVPKGKNCPTGTELVQQLLQPIAELPAISGSIELGCRVKAIGRLGMLKRDEIGTEARAQQPFRLLVVDAEGEERIDQADIVFDCTGSYEHPNWLGDGGIPAPGEAAVEDRIVRRIPDFVAEEEAWAGKSILLVGAGYSALAAARDLAALAEKHLGTTIVWAIRDEQPPWDAEAEDPLPERAALTRRAAEIAAGHPAVEVKTGMVVERLIPRNTSVKVILRSRFGGDEETVRVDRVLALTGSSGDHQLYRQLQVHECFATGAPMKLAAALLGSSGGDCLDQTSHGAETLKNPEPGFFILGSKSYGSNTTFLMRVGWEQVDEVFLHLTQE